MHLAEVPQPRISAEPNSCIGAPSEINLFWRKNVLIERSSDSGRKNAEIIYRISFWIIVENIKQSIEVVRVLIDVDYRYWALRANAHPQALDRGSDRRQRVFPLRRAIVSDHEWNSSWPNC
jgi:hypothetical protein